MEDFGFGEMQDMQIRLQEQYKDRWEPVCPLSGRNKLLWLMAELGEVIDIIKKDGNAKIMENSGVRVHFVEGRAGVQAAQPLFIGCQEQIILEAGQRLILWKEWRCRVYRTYQTYRI